MEEFSNAQTSTKERIGPRYFWADWKGFRPLKLGYLGSVSMVFLPSFWGRCLWRWGPWGWPTWWSRSRSGSWRWRWPCRRSSPRSWCCQCSWWRGRLWGRWSRSRSTPKLTCIWKEKSFQMIVLNSRCEEAIMNICSCFFKYRVQKWKFLPIYAPRHFEQYGADLALIFPAILQSDAVHEIGQKKLQSLAFLIHLAKSVHIAIIKHMHTYLSQFWQFQR